MKVLPAPPGGYGFNEKNPYWSAPYNDSTRTDATPYNAVYVGRNARMEVSPHSLGGKPHVELDYQMTKYFGRATNPRLTTEDGQTRFGELPRFSRENVKWPMTAEKFGRLLDDALAGVAALGGREIPDAAFSSRLERNEVLDSMKPSDVFVQVVRDGQVHTKIFDASAVTGDFAKTLKKLKVLD